MPAGKQMEVSLILSAYDKASRVINDMATKGEHRLMKMSEKSSELAEKSFKNGREFAEIGLVALEPLNLAAEAAEATEISVRRLNNAFKVTGDRSGRAGEESERYAEKLEKQIGVEKSEIMAVQAKLVIFKHVSGEAARMRGIFDRTTNAAYDMAAAGFGEASQNAVVLGKALESPTQGLNALRRSGIIFTKAEKEKIKVLEESGQLLKAQQIILTSVEGRVKGQSRAIVTQGQLTKVAYKEAMEHLGKTFLPIMVQVQKSIAGGLEKITKWIDKNPKLTQTIVKVVAIAGALSLAIGALSFVFGGLMKAWSFATGAGGIFLKLLKATTYQNAAAGIQTKIYTAATVASSIATKIASATMTAFRAVMVGVNAVLAINPFILIATAVIAVAALIYYNWDSIKKFFIKIWDGIKSIFSRAWTFIKDLFFKYHPLGIIIKNWGAIKEFFSKQWAGMKENFSKFVDFLKDIPHKMFEAGKNIVKSIWEGIKSFASKPVEAIKSIVKKIRDFLPFSPAKEGPLRDIHRIRLVETISENIKPGPMVRAMRKTVAATFMAANVAVASPNVERPVNGGGLAGGGGIHIHFNPQVSIQGGGVPDSDTMAVFDREFQKQKKELMKMLEQYHENKKRTAY